MRSSYGHTTAASSHILGGTSGSAAAHRHMMTFGDIKTSSFPKYDQPNQSMTPIARSADSTSWVEVQQNSKSPKPAYMRAGEIAEAQNERYRQEMMQASYNRSSSPLRASLNNNNNSSQHEPRRSHSSLRHKDSIEKQPDIEPRNDVRDSSENPYQLQSRGFEAQHQQ